MAAVPGQVRRSVRPGELTFRHHRREPRRRRRVRLRHRSGPVPPSPARDAYPHGGQRRQPHGHLRNHSRRPAQGLGCTQHLEAGSTFTCAGDLSTEFPIFGGTATSDDGKQVVRVEAPVAIIGIPKASGELRPMELSLRLPSGNPAGTYRVVVSQRNTGWTDCRRCDVRHRRHLMLWCGTARLGGQALPEGTMIFGSTRVTRQVGDR
jgi:hypothetical protein